MGRILKLRGADGNWLEVPAIKGSAGATFTPNVSSEGVLSWENDKGLKNPDPISIKGPIGSEGATFTPHLSETGDLSWTNNKGLPNPDPVNIMGKVSTDPTLTVEGTPADAKATGDTIRGVEDSVSNTIRELRSGYSGSLKDLDDSKQPKGNYITSESDPTVPAWAKEETKPKYTADEVSALPKDGTAKDSSKLGGQSPSYYATSEEVSQLKNDLAYIGNVGFNLFDKTKIVKNTMYQSNTGILIDRDGYYTVFFPVDSANNLRIRCSQMPYRISLFDTSRNYISQIEGGAYAASISGASYVGITFEGTIDVDTIMVAYTQETSDAYSDKWSTLFPDAPEYVPYGFFVDAKSVSVDAYNNSIESLTDGLTSKNVIDRLSLIDGVVIATDEYLGVKKATFAGATATKTHAQFEIPCIPCKTYLLEFLGMSNYVDYSADFTRGAMLIVEFFDNNGSIIGSKYNSYVLGYNRLGYHRYGFVSPFGAKTVKIRFTTRANTNMTVANVSFKCVESYPQKQRNGILYDGHQGMPFAAPKNTLASFELGKIAGFSTMITNINVTSDGVLVALHDDTIDATSNGSGNVRDYTYSELLNYDFGSWFNAAYTGTKIPKFEDVVKYLSTCGIKLGVSLHDNTLTNDELDKMCEIIKKYGQRDCLIKSFSFDTLAHVLSVLGNDAEYMWDYNATSTSDIDSLIALGADRVTLEFDSDSANDTVIEYARANGVDCSVYFGNDIAQVKALVNKGITRFTVDTFSDIVFPMD